MATPAAQVVGDAFVQQYYSILHMNPELVHKFYQDISKLGRPDKDGTMSITSTMNAIRDKILSLNYDSYRSEISSVDAQESYEGGVHVLVTGYFTGKGGTMKNFAQTFFLAPQERGYFVLNDMLRFVEVGTIHDANQAIASEEVVSVTPEPMVDSCTPEESSTRYHCIDSIGSKTEAGSSRGSQPIESDLAQEVLESLFNMPVLKNSEQEPNNMNWKRFGKKFKSLGQKIVSYPSNSEAGHINQANEDDSLVDGKSAKQHWDSMRSYYQKASIAFKNNEKEHAAHLSELGQAHKQKAREGDFKASRNIFIDRNKSIENMVTMDLHGQHVNQAIQLLKLHLLFGAYVRSEQSFRVITGRGRHGDGKAKMKHTVIRLLDKEGISWREENSGTLLVKLDGRTDFSFLDTDSDED